MQALMALAGIGEMLFVAVRDHCKSQLLHGWRCFKYISQPYQTHGPRGLPIRHFSWAAPDTGCMDERTAPTLPGQCVE